MSWPISVMVTLLTLKQLMESVAVPEPPVIVVGVNVELVPGPEPNSEKFTVPVNPLTGLTVIVDVADP